VARILVVDDEPDIRRLLDTVLTDEGHEVTLAQDGQHALEIMLKEPPDVLVLDIMMPRLDGYGVLKEMRYAGLRESTKILMLSAKNYEADWLRGYKHGAHQYLTKPFDPDELIEAINKLLGMSHEQLSAHTERELDRAQLLSRLESLFNK
jgi:DNA-binding response OmpR family regulator